LQKLKAQGNADDMDKKKINNSCEEEKDMSTALDNKKITLQEMLDKISSKSDALTGKKGMIELNPDNPLHKEWFEDDKYKGQ